MLTKGINYSTNYFQYNPKLHRKSSVRLIKVLICSILNDHNLYISGCFQITTSTVRNIH